MARIYKPVKPSSNKAAVPVKETKKAAEKEAKGSRTGGENKKEDDSGGI